MRWLQRLAPYALASGLLIGLKQSPAVEPFNLLLFDLGAACATGHHLNYQTTSPL